MFAFTTCYNTLYTQTSFKGSSTVQKGQSHVMKKNAYKLGELLSTIAKTQNHTD